MHLKINPVDRILWINHPTYKNAVLNEDVGLDIPMANDYIIEANVNAKSIDLGFKCESSHGWMLVPRSSISKTPLRLANSIGIIDKSYRGKVMVKVDNISDELFMMEKGKCYFQIVAFDGNLPTWEITKDISKTHRDTGGFGSTTQ